MQDVIRIGTRKSRLALVQTNMVKERIEETFPGVRVELVEMSTRGDEQLNRSLASFGGKGVFTKELEEALLTGAVDLAVHSAKDMPMEFPEGLEIGAVLPRGAVQDVIVTLDGTPIRDLRPGSVVGTSSLRRELQIREINPLIRTKVIRGNVETRLRKLAAGEYDAVVLAAAGLERLGLVDSPEYHFEYLDTSVCLPAAGQAILAVEHKKGHLTELLEKINDPKSMICLNAERAYLEAIGGSCNAPAAALACLEEEVLSMDVMYAGTAGHPKKISGNCVTGLDAELASRLGKKLAGHIRQGKVWLAGAGPGDRHLVTQRCLSLIREADVIIYDNLASESLLNEASRTAELIYAGKRASAHHLKQEETNDLLIQKAREGKMVLRLKGGDPFIFGRGGEEAQALAEAGIEFEIVPGVSSCYSAPAYAGIPVTHRDCASSFHVITGHEGSHKEKNVLDYATLAKEEGTLVFLMGLKNLPNIMENLIENGKNPDTPVAVVQEGTTAHQKTAVGTLKTIVEEVSRMGIQTPAISIVGNVVSLKDAVSWFGQRPLSGKRVLVTATEQVAEKLCGVLEEEGAETAACSLIHTEPLGEGTYVQAMEHLEDYTWIVFTSANGVGRFFEMLLDKPGRDIRCLANIKFAVIGTGTKTALEKHGIRADFVPTRFSSKCLAEEWVQMLKPEDKVLLLRAQEASRELNQALDQAGIVYTDAPIYHTVTDMRKAEELNRILSKVDYVTFCSASAVKAFASMVDKKELDAKIICIGPVTEKAAVEAGFKVYQSAVTYTAEGIRDVLLYDLKRGN